MFIKPIQTPLRYFGAAVCMLFLTACNGDGSSSSSPATLSSATVDQSVSEQEAVALVQNQSSTSEPSSITSLNLQTAETEEPFGL